MPGQNGTAFLFQRGDEGDPENFVPMGGFTSHSMSLGKEQVDITDKDSAGYRELLEGAGTKTLSLSGSGLFKDKANKVILLADFAAGAHKNYELIAPGLGTFTGPFELASIDFGGENQQGVTFSLSLESATAWTFTPAA